MDLTNPGFILFAAIAPLLIALIKQQAFSTQVNALIALACYVVVGILGAVTSGQALTLENAVGLIAVATVVGSAAYNLVWDNLGKVTTPTTTGLIDTTPSLDKRITNATSIFKPSPALG